MVFNLNFQFGSKDVPACLEACNANGGILDISDPIYLLNYLFLGGDPPTGNFPACDVAPVERCARDICET